MKIVRIRHLFYPDMPRDYFYELSDRQAKTGNKVDLITWRKNATNRSEEKIAEGFTVHRLKGVNLSPSCIVQDYPFLPSLPSELEKLNPDIVHCESHLFIPTIQALSKAKKLGIPYVITVHGVFAERNFFINFAQHAYLHTIGLSAFRSANKVICLTHSDALEIKKLGCLPDKIVLIKNAIDSDFFKPFGKRSDNLIVWVGRFVEEKGVKYIVEATKHISKNSPDVKVVLIGYGPLKNEIIELARSYGLLGKSLFIDGPFSREKVAKILGKATIFVFPSLKEGMPISLLEAMACELPVVVFNVPGITEIVEQGKNGLIVEPRNSEQLSRAILYLLNNENQRKALGENARQRVVENNNWKTILNSIDKVYSDAINEMN